MVWFFFFFGSTNTINLLSTYRSSCWNQNFIVVHENSPLKLLEIPFNVRIWRYISIWFAKITTVQCPYSLHAWKTHTLKFPWHSRNVWSKIGYRFIHTWLVSFPYSRKKLCSCSSLIKNKFWTFNDCFLDLLYRLSINWFSGFSIVLTLKCRTQGTWLQAYNISCMTERFFMLYIFNT